MSVAGDEDRGFRKFRSQQHDAVGEIVAAGPLLQAHVAGENHRVCAGRAGLANGTAHRFDRVLELDSLDEPGHEPKRHSRCR